MSELEREKPHDGWTERFVPESSYRALCLVQLQYEQQFVLE